MRIKKLILFDIDGTLLRFDMSAAYAAPMFELVAKRFFGVQVKLQDIDFAGKTDIQILRELVVKEGIKDKLFSHCKDQLDIALTKVYTELVDKSDLQNLLLPNVKEALKRAYDHGACLGILTGNIEGIAWYKLGAAGIHKYFVAGGFGSDSEVRTELVGVVLNRVQEVTRHAFKPREVLLIGDTPKDVVCGQMNNVEVWGVSTGPYTADTLRAAGAARVYNNMAELSVDL